jgi:hypothetical protein
VRVAFITYGNVGSDELCGKVISIANEDQEEDVTDGPYAEFQDYDGKLITIPIHQTKTFFVRSKAPDP